ncbi:UbiX family flavin prenyltransferase [Breoghania sp. JC706]|uniref:UbiX family flavin prenyltransferase n=1 Tax=Breoghania sp. JC706 TaxID=3117732 RepID=UPI00300A76E5
MDRKRLIIGISGASGAIYGIRALELLRRAGGVETHLVLSPAALSTVETETDFTGAEVAALADVVHDFRDVGASIASGSYRTLGMLVAPCSIKTLSGIANSHCDSLLTRAADVCLKERRRLVMMVRETPLHAGHLELMERATRSGAVIMPPVPAFYTKPQSLDDVVTHSVARALDLFDIEIEGVRRWKDG